MKLASKLWVVLLVAAFVREWEAAALANGRVARFAQLANHLSVAGGSPAGSVRSASKAFSAVIDELKPDDSAPSARSLHSARPGDTGGRKLPPPASAHIAVTATPTQHGGPGSYGPLTGLKIGSSLRQEARELLIQKAQQTGPKLDLAIYGDAIAAALGSSRGESAMRMYREHYRTESFGISGDKVDNLLFRLRHGELPNTMRPKTFMIWIGMNNLRLNKTVPTRPLTVSGALEMRKELKKEWLPIIETLRQHDGNARILLAGMTPFSSRGLSNEWPNIFANSVKAANQAMDSAAEQDSMTFFSDCSGVLLQAPTDGKLMSINQTRVPDLVLPNDEGHMAIARCQLRSLDRINKGLGPLHFTQPMEPEQGDFSMHPGTACSDATERSVSALDYKRCLAFCQETEWCMAFSFKKHSKECNLKKRCNESKYDLKWTSGLRLGHP